ncbi:hypothetical protein J9T75_002913 [Salmonella enterica]|uniref:Uncharacterized protein n=1 Tax=Salmonella enterica I TaxID=59201 RepID=A0A612H4Q5_SALET|nr:hypothetical protein [Salmonella enterica subsp. enterica]EHJ3657695.1 hypothetical protein [Salmonella enterica]HED0198842.1 hypothetical protein [Salmonella enterica subsp. enterica serovar Orientalis]
MKNFKGFEGCKNFEEIVKFCARENRKADIKEAESDVYWHVSKVVKEMEGKKGVKNVIGKESVLLLSFDELAEEIHRAYFAGLKKGREIGGLESL